MAAYLAACFTSRDKFFCCGYGAIGEGPRSAQGDCPLLGGWLTGSQPEGLQAADGAPQVMLTTCVAAWSDPWGARVPSVLHIVFRAPGRWEGTEWAGTYFCQNFRKQKKWQKASQLEAESRVFVSCAALEAVLAVCSLAKRRGASCMLAKAGPK